MDRDVRILILIILLTLPGCTMVAKHALTALTGASSNGVSLDAQVGDRDNVLGDSIGEVRGETVSVETGDRGFSGAAENVTIFDTNYTGLFSALILGLIVGIFIDPKKFWTKRA